jgi:hypothetical protein
MPISLAALDDNTFYTDEELEPLLSKSQRFFQRARAERRLGFARNGKTPISSGKQVKQLLGAGEVKPVRRRG